MESSPEHLATICVDYRVTSWMRRNARENNFAWYSLAIFQAHVVSVQTYTDVNEKCVLCSSLCYSRGYSFKLQ